MAIFFFVELITITYCFTIFVPFPAAMWFCCLLDTVWNSVDPVEILIGCSFMLVIFCTWK